jgi:hypothetical protein
MAAFLFLWALHGCRFGAHGSHAPTGYQRCKFDPESRQPVQYVLTILPPGHGAWGLSGLAPKLHSHGVSRVAT